MCWTWAAYLSVEEQHKNASKEGHALTVADLLQLQVWPAAASSAASTPGAAASAASSPGVPSVAAALKSQTAERDGKSSVLRDIHQLPGHLRGAAPSSPFPGAPRSASRGSGRRWSCTWVRHRRGWACWTTSLGTTTFDAVEYGLLRGREVHNPASFAAVLDQVQADAGARVAQMAGRGLQDEELDTGGLFGPYREHPKFVAFAVIQQALAKKNADGGIDSSLGYSLCVRYVHCANALEEETALQQVMNWALNESNNGDRR